MSHYCNLPFGVGILPVTGLPDGTVKDCQCGTRWVVRRVAGAPIPMQEWRKVRWWHFRLRREITLRIGGGDE